MDHGLGLLLQFTVYPSLPHSLTPFLLGLVGLFSWFHSHHGRIASVTYLYIGALGGLCYARLSPGVSELAAISRVRVCAAAFIRPVVFVLAYTN